MQILFLNFSLSLVNYNDRITDFHSFNVFNTASSKHDVYETYVLLSIYLY